MATNCFDRGKSVIGVEPNASAFTGAPLPCWSWLYEFRLPISDEAQICAAGGAQHAAVLQALADPESPIELADIFDAFLEEGQVEMACVTCVSGINVVLEAGRDFGDFKPWLLRVDTLLGQPSLSALGRGALFLHYAMAQLLGASNLYDVALTLDELEDAAEEAGSDALRIAHASLRAHCELMSGRLQVATSVVSDALHISPDPASQTIPKLHLQASLGLVNILTRRVGDARECLDAMIRHPSFDRLPGILWLVCMGHRLLSLAIAGDQPAELETIAERIRARSIPAHKYYHQSYMHYALGASALLTGQPETALFHAKKAMDLGVRCHSILAERTSTLLVIQALADTGQHEPAQNLLVASTNGWQRAGAHLLIACGALEDARLLASQGRFEEARAALDRARAVLPEGEVLPCNLRSRMFVDDLVARLSPSQPALVDGRDDSRPIQITTFGELSIEINGRRLYDRDWHGSRGKALLKALIVLGGYKVSAERLGDLLWPDAEGDVARNNLKVALWRLRRLGCRKEETPLPWVVTQHGHVSLVSGLCRIDCIEFEQKLNSALVAASPENICEALSLFGDDFFAQDDSEAWIVRHRENLRQCYLKGARVLAETVLSRPSDIDPSPYLEAALRLVPSDIYYQELLATSRNRLVTRL